MRQRRLFLFVPFLLLFSSAAWGKIDTVKMVDFAFVPANLTVNAFDTVVWKSTQECCIPHTTTRTLTPMTWNSGDVPLGNTFQVVFPDTGTFNYVCLNHEFNGMVGTIRVQFPRLPVLGWLGLILLLASLAATGAWLLLRRRQIA